MIGRLAATLMLLAALACSSSHTGPADAGSLKVCNDVSHHVGLGQIDFDWFGTARAMIAQESVTAAKPVRDAVAALSRVDKSDKAALRTAAEKLARACIAQGFSMG